MIQIKATLSEYEATLVRATLMNHFDTLRRCASQDEPTLPDIVKGVKLLQFEPQENLQIDAYKWLPATVKMFDLDSELAFTIQLNSLSQFPNSFPLRHPHQKEALEGTLLPLSTLSGYLPCPSNTQKSGPCPALLASFEIALTCEDLSYANPPFAHFFPLGIKKGKICFPPSANFLTPPQPVQQPPMFNFPPPSFNPRYMQSARHVSFQNNANSSYEVRPPYISHSLASRSQRTHLSRANNSFPPAHRTAVEDPRVTELTQILQHQEDDRRARDTRVAPHERDSDMQCSSGGSAAQGQPLLGNLGIAGASYTPCVAQPGTLVTPQPAEQRTPTTPLDSSNPEINHTPVQPLVAGIISPPLATSNPSGDQQFILTPSRTEGPTNGTPPEAPDAPSIPATLTDELLVDHRTRTPDSVEMIAEANDSTGCTEPRRKIVPASGDANQYRNSRLYLEGLTPFLDDYSKQDKFAGYLNPFDKENPQRRTYSLPPHLKILNETLLARINDHPGPTPFAARLFPFYTYDITQQKYLVDFQHLTLDILQKLNSVSKATLALENPLKMITTRLRSKSK